MTPAAAKIRAWREDPILFAREVCAFEPDDWQADLLLSVKNKPRTAAKACKGPGKTAGEAIVTYWFLTVFPHPNILATSITGDNLRDNLWKELAVWRGKSKLLTELFDWTETRISSKQHPETWFASARKWAKDADPQQQANTLAGLHADYTLVIADECGDMPSGVVEAGEGSLSTGKVNRILIAGNPTRTDGPLYDACTKFRALWNVIEITGDPDNPKRAKRISLEWARDQIKKWGRNNPWVKVNVFGEFPPKQANKLLGPDECRASADLVVPEEEWMFHPRIMGVDFARGGNAQSVLTCRQGRVAFKQKPFRERNTMFLVGEIGRAIDKWSPHAVFCDETGLGGPIVDRLRQLGYDVMGINFASQALDPRRFNNIRTEMWFKASEWVQDRGCIPDDPELISDLTAPTFDFDRDNRMRLESKEEMEKRGIASPDCGDALALTFAAPVAMPEPETFVPSTKPGRGKVDFCISDYDPLEGI